MSENFFMLENHIWYKEKT